MPRCAVVVQPFKFDGRFDYGRIVLWNMSESGHRACECGAVYDRSEHIAEAREIRSFEWVVCGKTIEN
jgi:hypothetical protein